MDLNEYQVLASSTDQFPSTQDDDGASLVIPILGIIGETGSLISCFKKSIRDGDAYQAFSADLMEEAGDVLWYLANICSKYDISLEEVARRNLAKASDRWRLGGAQLDLYSLLDDAFPEEERIPRNMRVEFYEKNIDGKNYMTTTINGRLIGNPLTDNVESPDGYRFHDIFHLAYAAILGWSPVLRKLMKIKRKSNPSIDEYEDGARAWITEEAISLFIFGYAKKHRLLEGLKELDQENLQAIRTMVADFEVRVRTTFDWKMAILEGFKVYRDLVKHNGGTVDVDLNERKIIFLGKS